MKPKKQSSPQLESVEKEVAQAKKPSMYNVFILNDKETPMEFVVELLQRVFMMSADHAMQVMYQAHLEGKALCGKYSKDVAETKIAQVESMARRYGYPTSCTMEKV